MPNNADTQPVAAIEVAEAPKPIYHGVGKSPAAAPVVLILRPRPEDLQKGRVNVQSFHRNADCPVYRSVMARDPERKTDKLRLSTASHVKSQVWGHLMPCTRCWGGEFSPLLQRVFYANRAYLLHKIIPTIEEMVDIFWETKPAMDAFWAAKAEREAKAAARRAKREARRAAEAAAEAADKAAQEAKKRKK